MLQGAGRIYHHDQTFCSTTCLKAAHAQYFAAEAAVSSQPAYQRLLDSCRKTGERWPALAARLAFTHMQSAVSTAVLAHLITEFSPSGQAGGSCSTAASGSETASMPSGTSVNGSSSNAANRYAPASADVHAGTTPDSAAAADLPHAVVRGFPPYGFRLLTFARIPEPFPQQYVEQHGLLRQALAALALTGPTNKTDGRNAACNSSSNPATDSASGNSDSMTTRSSSGRNSSSDNTYAELGLEPNSVPSTHTMSAGLSHATHTTADARALQQLVGGLLASPLAAHVAGQQQEQLLPGQSVSAAALAAAQAAVHTALDDTSDASVVSLTGYMRTLGRIATNSYRVDCVSPFAATGDSLAAMAAALVAAESADSSSTESAARGASEGNNDESALGQATVDEVAAKLRNSFHVGEPGGDGAGNSGSAVYLLASLLNHSCEPNLAVSWPQNDGMMQLTAARDVSAGEQMGVSYVDGEMALAVRQEHLRYNYGFVCGCQKCVEEAEGVWQQ